MEAVQEESSAYPTQVVPSGARYTELRLSHRTEVYEFRSTKPYDPRNCHIRLPLLTDVIFGIEETFGTDETFVTRETFGTEETLGTEEPIGTNESNSCHNNAATSDISSTSLTYSMEVEARDASDVTSTSNVQNNQS